METFITKLLHLPPVATEHGHQVDRLLLYVHLLMAALFVGWGAFYLYSLYRFRARKQPKADYAGVRSHASSYLEIAVAGIEAVLLIGFAIPIWARGATAGNFPPEKDATVVRVIGRQFNWLARYPGADGKFGAADPKFVTAQNPLGMDPDDPQAKDDVVAEGSEIAVPLGKPVIAYVGSLDVIHSFAVKPLRVTQDAIPGLSIPVWFTPTHAGTYQITCAQLCGNGHFSMRGLFKVLEPAEYTAWLASKRGTPAAGASYE